MPSGEPIEQRWNDPPRCQGLDKLIGPLHRFTVRKAAAIVARGRDQLERIIDGAERADAFIPSSSDLLSRMSQPLPFIASLAPNGAVLRAEAGSDALHGPLASSNLPSACN